MNTESLNNSGNYIVNWNNGADLEIDIQVIYIKSGEQDIQKYVSEVIVPQLNQVVAEAREQVTAAETAAANAENSLFFTQSAAESVASMLEGVGNLSAVLDNINGEVA